MGGRPSHGTPADKRLTENRPDRSQPSTPKHLQVPQHKPGGNPTKMPSRK